MNNPTLTATEFKKRIDDNLLRYYGTEPDQADL